jgi:hypothetical protein
MANSDVRIRIGTLFRHSSKAWGGAWKLFWRARSWPPQLRCRPVSNSNNDCYAAKMTGLGE